MEQAYPRAKDEKLVTHELRDELLVYDLERHRAHSLNRTAALVWRHCDGKTSVAEIAALLNRELSLPADEQVVWMALARLQRAHLLQERVVAPEDGTSYSRRAMMRKLGLAGGLALLLPLVESIISPAAAANGTLGTGACCTDNSQCASNKCKSHCSNCPGSGDNCCSA